MRQVEFGSVHYSLAGLVAACYADGLRMVMGLLTSGASGLARLRSAPVLCLRQFVAGVINHILLRMTWRQWKLKTHKAFGEHDHCDQQQALQQPGDEHSAIGEHAHGRFSGQALWRASEGRAERGLELFPARRPFHEQTRRLGPLDGNFGYGGNISH